MADIDGANFTGIWAPTLAATTRSGGFPGRLLGLGAFSVTGCDGRSMAPSDFSVEGATFEQCELFFGLASDPIASIEYWDKPYEQATTKALTWRTR